VGVVPAVIIGVVMTMVTAAALVWLRGKRGARLAQVAMAVALSVGVLAGNQGPANAFTQPPSSSAWNVVGEANIPGVQTYTSPHGGCLFLEANQTKPNNGGLWGNSGVPTMGTYGSINWNSQLNGSGTPCANTSFQETGADFYVVQWLDVYDSATGAWVTCNFGSPIYNPGPASHAVTTLYSWSSPPGNCWDPGDANAPIVYYSEQASIADVYYDGYGVWAYSSNGPGEYFPAYISVNPVS
jgi:hypothetical protein